MKKQFLINNEKNSHEFALKIYWVIAIMQFPVGYFLAKLGILKVKPYFFLLFFIILIPAILLLQYLLKKELYLGKLKYFILIFLLANISLVNITYGNDVSMQLTWLFPVILSCLYFDKELTIMTVGGSLICAFIVSKIAPIFERTNKPGDLLITLSILSVLIVVILYFLVRRVHNIFMSLVDAEERNTLLERLNKVIKQSGEVSAQLYSTVEMFASASEQVGKSINQIAENTALVSQNVEEVMGQTDNTEHLVTEIVNTSEQVASHSSNISGQITESIAKTDNAVAIISDALSNIEVINEKMDTITATTEQLLERSREIKEITDLMNRISNQTNILALNAAIEASRAGAGGRSFTVIANEIQKFAKNLQEWNNKINEIVSYNEESILQTVGSVDEVLQVNEEALFKSESARKELDSIRQINKDNNLSLQNMTLMIKEQMAKIREIPDSIKIIASSIRDIATSAENTAVSSEETSASMQELVATAQNLQSMAEVLEKVIKN